MTMQGMRFTKPIANTNVRGAARGMTNNPADPSLVGNKSGQRKSAPAGQSNQINDKRLVGRNPKRGGTGMGGMGRRSGVS